jgi:hypothetical protein
MIRKLSLINLFWYDIYQTNSFYMFAFLYQKESLIWRSCWCLNIYSDITEGIHIEEYIRCMSSKTKSINIQVLVHSILIIWYDTSPEYLYSTVRHVLAKKVTKGVVRSCKSKDRQHNDHKKKGKKTNNDLKSIHIKLKID